LSWTSTLAKITCTIKISLINFQDLREAF
jgi:hypothetical protein